MYSFIFVLGLFSSSLKMDLFVLCHDVLEVVALLGAAFEKGHDASCSAPTTG